MGGQQGQGHGVVLSNQGKGYQPRTTSRRRSSQVCTLRSQYDPHFPSRLTGGPQGQGHGVVLHDHGKGYQPSTTPRRGSSQVP